MDPNFLGDFHYDCSLRPIKTRASASAFSVKELDFDNEPVWRDSRCFSLSQDIKQRPAHCGGSTFKSQRYTNALFTNDGHIKSIGVRNACGCKKQSTVRMRRLLHL